MLSTEPILLKKHESTQITRFTFHLLKLYYKLYRDKLPPYFENFIPQYGAYHQNLRNNHIRLPAIRCEFEKNNSKYQMHFRFRELASPSNPPLYPNIELIEMLFLCEQYAIDYKIMFNTKKSKFMCFQKNRI